ncbi:MAG: hypothetical protein KA974_06320 [Saprospiraceae bacterium]|nr:hypothetical protein [Saprospiraceae bacterium]
MRIHLIAIGGSVMHNIALALQKNGHIVSGSDDEIYNPAKERLAKAALLPDVMGWNENNITPEIDLVILGMHARSDNPELLKAQVLQLRVVSYPEFIYQHAKDKLRIAVAGSHGKTTTTAMIIHILKENNISFDYLVGAQLDGFNNMVRFSDAPIMVIEADEYLASPIDTVPKMNHYHPQISVITGIAWDHINVFPTFENYVEQFSVFVKNLSKTDTLYYYSEDEILLNIVNQVADCQAIGYTELPFLVVQDTVYLLTGSNKIALQIFGEHNLQNLHAAYLVARQLGLSDDLILRAVQTFRGAAKRLQELASTATSTVFLDFAHAPSKVRATVNAVKSKFAQRKLVACLELHTFSSLNESFHPLYKNTLAAADEAHVFFSEHTLKMKKMPPINKTTLAEHFQNKNVTVHTDVEKMWALVLQHAAPDTNLLLMSSGSFNGSNLSEIANRWINKIA